MLRTALALLSSLQIGGRLKQSFERSLRQAIVVAIAVVVLIAAGGFGLLAAYQALQSIGQFTQMEAAGILAAALLLLGMLILALVPLIGRKPGKPAAPQTAMMGAAEGIGLVDQQLGRAMQQVGPVTLIAIAFLAGILASRKR